MKIALQFSGGKDSLACLFLLRPQWDKVTVYWLNTGAAFPETIALMDQVKKLVPNFVEIKTNQSENIKVDGWPVDVFPIRNSVDAGLFYDSARVRLQPFINCCLKNLMLPLQQRMIDDGITTIIRGQRSEEVHKGVLRDGDVENGITYLFPIQDWNGAQVREFIAKQETTLPEHYTYMDTSLDCWNCTAYLEENIGKRRYMAEKHPEKYAVVTNMLKTIFQETEKDLSFLREAIAT